MQHSKHVHLWEQFGVYACVSTKPDFRPHTPELRHQVSQRQHYITTQQQYTAAAYFERGKSMIASLRTPRDGSALALEAAISGDATCCLTADTLTIMS